MTSRSAPRACLWCYSSSLRMRMCSSRSSELGGGAILGVLTALCIRLVRIRGGDRPAPIQIALHSIISSAVAVSLWLLCLATANQLALIKPMPMLAMIALASLGLLLPRVAGLPR
jgi:hypothetical protein